MKTILPICCLLYLLCTTNLFSQASCDSTIAGINMNLSINANCRLDVDTSIARMLLSNPYPDITYNALVTNSDGDTVSNILTEEQIGETFKIAITGSGCATGSGSGAMFGAWATLNLEDKIDPVITCSDTTLSCVDFFFYKDAGGIVEECDLDTVQTIFMDFEPACDPMRANNDISTIATRTFRAIDNSGNADTCTQQINIRRLSRSDILFPSDLMVNCDTLKDVTNSDGNLIPPSLTLATGSGTLMGQYIFGVPTGSGASFYGNNFRECRVRAYYNDVLSYEGLCETRYHREWTVYEWYCDGEEIEYSHMQTITFKDTTPPEFSFVSDTLYVDLDNDQCDVTIPIDSLGIENLSDNCSSDNNVSIKIFSPIVRDKGSDSTLYISGIDTVEVSLLATDLCLKESLKKLVVITRDKTRPTAICMATMQVALSNAHTNRVPVEDFNVGSYDPCGDVTFSARKMTVDTFSSDFINFDCSDGEEAMVVFQVTDANGLINQCMTTVTIKQDTFCQNTSPINSGVSGYVRYIDNIPLDGAEVTVENMSNLTTKTNKEGFYQFDELEHGESIEIMPIKDNNHELGITTLDVILLQRHMMGLEDLDSPYKIIAGDINQNGSIDAIDLIELRKLILGKTDRFTDSKSYAFVPESLSFIDPYDPWENGKVLGLTTTVDSDMESVNFMALKVGDVNHSFLSAEQRSSNQAILEYETVEMGRYVEMNITAKEDMNITGLQTTLSFDSELLRMMKIGSNNIGLRSEHYNIEESDNGIIPISWNELSDRTIKAGDVIFRATFERMYDGEVWFSFISELMSSELYQSEEVIALNLEPKAEALSENFEVYQNTPNPWASSTDIKFNLPIDTEVELNIYDASMSKVVSKSGFFKAGPNKFTVDYDDLDDTGIYFYEIIQGDQVRISKMTKL